MADSVALQKLPKRVSTWANDLPAGLVVALVALPLCLGIATASGASPLSGIIAGVIGGILVGLLSGSSLSVSGPAAGLVSIVITGLTQLGNSFQALQVALVIAGGIQVLLGVLRLGLIANFVPNSVIKGMLAGIGIVIILKQIPHALGWDKDYMGDLGFFRILDRLESNTFSDIAKAVFTITPTALGIFVLCAATIIFWESKPMAKQKWTKFVPGPLVAIAIAATISQVLRGSAPAMALNPADGHLVKLPQTSELFSAFKLPDWNAFQNSQVWTIAFTLAIVATLETLLSIDAADKLDSERRVTPTNRELMAQGVGNCVSGFIGGLPITSVVVRSSANAYSGAKTKISTIFHGILLALAVLLIPSALNAIPLSGLAAVLILVGYKLTKPKIFQKVYQGGMDQFVPFMVTMLGVVFTDLLKGVIVGMIFGLFYVLWANHHKAFTLVHEDNWYMLRFNKDITFTSKASLRGILDRIPDNVNLIISGTKADFVDHDILDMLEDFTESGKFRGIEVEIIDVAGKTWFSNMRRHKAFLKGKKNG